MSFQLTKPQSKELSELTATASVKKADLEQAIEEYNHAIADLFTKLENTQSELNSAAGAVKEFIAGLVADWRAEYDEKSEKWQEGDRGLAVGEFISEWEEFGDNIDEVELDEPDELATPDLPDFTETPAEAVEAG